MKKLLLALALVSALCAGALEIVKDGKSPFSIYCAKDAPSSVAHASCELQAYCLKTTGVKLPIVNTPTAPMISLGGDASLDISGVPLEGYRLKVQNGSLFIAGPDTTNGATTPQGGTSNGTANGVYSFIEDFLGVRWLMPGPNGDYIPSLKGLSVPDNLDVTVAPTFRNRRLPYIQLKRPEVQTWMAHQKLGFSLLLNHGHNWHNICRPSMYKEHPEWYAFQKGQHIIPAGDRYKLCITNESTIQRVADCAIAHFDKYPQSSVFSLSPTDSDGWCDCPRCSALYETDPLGQLSVTPAILTFYNRVAKIVARKYPERLLCGYVYAAYVFPPKTPIPLAPNIYPVWAPSFDYGYTLFRPDVRKLFSETLEQWRKVTKNMAFYDLPNLSTNKMGFPRAPGLSIMAFIYPQIAKAGMQGVYVYGGSDWGTSAVTNYIQAKLAWNAYLDVNELFVDFCDKAYAQASPQVQALYRLLDDATENFFNKFHSESYTISPRRMKEVFAATYPELERLFLAGRAKVTAPTALARLDYMGLNIKLMQWNLKNLGYLPTDYASPLTVTDDNAVQIMLDPANALMLQEGRAIPFPMKGKRINAVPDSPARLAQPSAATVFRGRQSIVAVALADGKAGIGMIPVRTYGDPLCCNVFNRSGEILSRAVLKKDKPFLFDVRAGEQYVISLETRNDFFKLKSTNLAWALLADKGESGMGAHFLGSVDPLFIFVPPSTKSFRMWLSATPPGETAKATLIAPSGKSISFNCSTKPIDEQTVTVNPGDDGAFWKLVVTVGDQGVLDDVYIRILDGIPPFLSTQPDARLRVSAFTTTKGK